MGKVVTIRELIALLGQPFQLVMIRAVVMVAIDVKMTVFLVFSVYSKVYKAVFSPAVSSWGTG